MDQFWFTLLLLILKENISLPGFRRTGLVFVEQLIFFIDPFFFKLNREISCDANNTSLVIVQIVHMPIETKSPIICTLKQCCDNVYK